MTQAQRKSKQTKLVWNGKELNLTADDMSIISNDCSIDKNGKAIFKDITIIKGNSKLSTDQLVGMFTIKKNDNTDTMLYMDNYILGINNNDEHIEIDTLNGPGIDVYVEGISGSYIKHTEIRTPKLTQTSLATEKKNFEKYTESALSKIKDIDIYKYNLKSEEDTDKKHIGFVIGKDYKYSKEVTSTDNQGVDNYSFTSLCCKAIQEQQELIEQLQEEIKKLKEEK